MIRGAWNRWDRFWFASTDPLPLGAVRIALGVVMTLWTLTLFGQLAEFFTANGVAGTASSTRGWSAWTILGSAPSPTALGAAYLALLLAAVALTVGWHTRVASIVVFVGAVSLQRTDPYVFNSGDSLLRLLCLYVAIAPAGAALSLDARRRGQRRIPAWPLRLIQLQVSVMYLAAVWAKLRGPAWRDGSATGYALRASDVVRFPLGDLLERWPALVQVATYSTIAIEAALVVLVWPRRTRLYALLAGAALHLGIELGLRVGFFTLAVLVAYLSFLDPAWVRRAARGRRSPAAPEADVSMRTSNRKVRVLEALAADGSPPLGNCVPATCATLVRPCRRSLGVDLALHLLPFPAARSRLVCSTTVLVLVALLAVASPAAAGWLPATGLSSPSSSSMSAVDLAMDSQGDAVAVWVRDGGTPVVEGATKTAGGGWSAAQTLSSAARSAASPHVAIDESGRAVVVWQESGGVSAVIRQRTVSAGVFSLAASLSVAESGRNAVDPQVVVNPIGAATVAWTRFNGVVDVIQAVTRDTADSAFSLPEDLSPIVANEPASNPRAAINAAGQAVVVWQLQTPGSAQPIEAAGRPAGGPWQPWQLVGAPLTGYSPDVALRPDGRATAVFQRGSSFSSIEYKVGTFSSWDHAPADDIAIFGRSPRVIAADDGTDIAIWTTLLSAGEQVLLATRTGRAFVAGRPIGQPVEFAKTALGLAGVPGVNTVAFWSQSRGGHWWAAVRPRGGDWGDVLEAPSAAGSTVDTSTNGSFAADADSDGTVLGVAPQRDNQSGVFRMYATVWDGAPPTLSAVSIPGQALTGESVALSASASDRWSGATLRWDLGDGTAATGGTLAHAYPQPGVYQVTVSATDEAGNVAVQSRAIQVTTPRRPDLDRDGFDDQHDCDDANPNIHPGARDVPQDRLDEDCNGRDAPFPNLATPIRLQYRGVSGGVRVKSLVVDRPPAGVRIQISCKGRSCPRKPYARTVRKAQRALELRGVFRGRRLRIGTVIEIRVRKPEFLGRMRRDRITARGTKTQLLCLDPRRPGRPVGTLDRSIKPRAPRAGEECG